MEKLTSPLNRNFPGQSWAVDDDDDVLFSSPEYSTEMQQSNMKHFTEEQEKQGGELVGSSGD